MLKSHSESLAFGTLLLTWALVAACNPPVQAPPAPETESLGAALAAESASPPAATAGTGARAPQGDAPAAVAPPPATGGTAADVNWLTWDQAHARAQAGNQPIMVFVYADWCPRCSELEPIFSTAPIQDAAQGVLMVRYNSDDNAPWIRDVVQNNDTYVPRVLFLNPDGSLKSLVSPHPRFPYFYTPQMTQSLVANLRAALAG